MSAITMRKISELRPNPVILELFPIDADTLNTVQGSIQDNGILTPILVGADGIVIDGHTRLRSALNLKLIEAPVKVLDMDGDSDEAVDLAINIQGGRRNLTSRQRMELVARVLSLHPKWADRRVSRQIGVSPTSVSKVREALKAGGKIEGDDDGERETAKGTTVATKGIAKASRNRASEVKKIPAVLTVDPALTVADLSAMEFDVDQLNAIARWADLLGQYRKTNPTPVSKAAREAEKAAEKAKAQAEKAQEKAKAKAAALRAKAEAAEAEAKAIAEGKAPKKAAKKGRK